MSVFKDDQTTYTGNVDILGSLNVHGDLSATGSLTTGSLTVTGALTVGGSVWTSAWTAYTPTSAFSTPGSSVMATPAGRWKAFGKVIFFSIDATCTTVGTGTGNWLLGLPTAANGIVGTSGKEVVNLGVALSIQAASATTISCVQYNNTSLATGGNGTRLQLAGIYEGA